jgi:hypothetical protein
MLNKYARLTSALLFLATFATWQDAQAQGRWLTPREAKMQRNANEPHLQTAALTKPAAQGFFVLSGTPGPKQYFKNAYMYRCQPQVGENGAFLATRESCGNAETPYSFPLNTKQTLPSGYYILGFENSLYPGFVYIAQNQITQVNLQTISTPANPATAIFKIYRDLSTLTEQRKTYFTEYVLGTQMFEEADYEDGDFYMAADGMESAVRSAHNKYCQNKTPESLISPDIEPKATRLCLLYALPSFMLATEFYDFDSSGSYTEYAVETNAKPTLIQHRRHLVSRPVAAGESVAVLPGTYVMEPLDGSQKPFKIRTQAANTGNYGFISGQIPAMLDAVQTQTVVKMKIAAKDPTADGTSPTGPCDGLKVWKTDLRSYCHDDGQEGCDRRQAQHCEPLYDLK